MLDQRLEPLEPKASFLLVSHSSTRGRVASAPSTFRCSPRQNPNQLIEPTRPTQRTALRGAQPPHVQTFSCTGILTNPERHGSGFANEYKNRGENQGK